MSQDKHFLMSKNFLVFGEILWDILPGKTLLGGAPFNVACRLNSLGDKCLFASRVGDDDLGKRARRQAQALGVDTRLLQTDDSFATGTVHVHFENNTPDYVILPGAAYDHIEITDELLQAAREAECLCFGTLTQRAETSRRTLFKALEQATQALKFLDINLRKDCYSRTTILSSLQAANILKVNDDEARRLGGILDFSFHSLNEFCQTVIDRWRLDYVLITLGEHGVFARSAEGEQVVVAGYKVRVVDTVGAGDAFSAGFMHCLLHGESLPSACEFGAALGALVAATAGATAAVAREEIEALMRSNVRRRVHPDFS